MLDVRQVGTLPRSGHLGGQTQESSSADLKPAWLSWLK